MLNISDDIKFAITITFFVYTFILIAVAFFSARHMAKTALNDYVDEFYTGGRGMGVILIAFITAAGICSSGTFVGGPGLNHALGLGYAMINFFSFVFTTLIALGAVGKKLGIVGRRINAATYMDVLLARYNDNKLILISGVSIIVVFLVTYCSSQFMGGARMLEVVTGLDYKVTLFLFAVVVVAYSAFGGIKGVGIAVVLQGAVMTIGALALGIAAIKSSGGLSNLFMNMEAYNPEFVRPQSIDLKFMVSLWVIFGFVYLAMPHGVLSALTYRSSKALHKAIFIGAILVPIWSFSTGFAGCASIGIVPGLEVADHATPAMASMTLHPILAGLTIAGAAAAAQSTISAMILAVSGILLKNCYERLNKNATARQLRNVSIIATLVVGITTYIMALDPPSQLEWIVMFAIGGLAASFFWPMLLGLYWPRMNQYGAIASMLVGIFAYMIGKYFYKPIALGMDPVVVGLSLSLIAAIVVSLLTPPTDMRTLQVFWGAEPVDK